MKLRLNPVACDGRGVCAQLIGELITLDEWGYPIIGETDIPPELHKAARQAASACPTLALRVVR